MVMDANTATADIEVNAPPVVTSSITKQMYVLMQAFKQSPE
jgi:hypothetical protein